MTRAEWIDEKEERPGQYRHDLPEGTLLRIVDYPWVNSEEGFAITFGHYGNMNRTFGEITGSFNTRLKETRVCGTLGGRLRKEDSELLNHVSRVENSDLPKDLQRKMSTIFEELQKFKDYLERCETPRA